MRTFKHLPQPGEKYGNWTVTGHMFVEEGHKKISCQCICGVTRDVYVVNLTQGKSKACRPQHNPSAATSWKNAGNQAWRELKAAGNEDREVVHNVWGMRRVKPREA